MTEIIFFKDVDGSEPVKDWLNHQPYDARKGAIERFKALQEHGISLGRPYIAPLIDGFFEIRWKHYKVNYRILCFLDGDEIVILTNGFTKQQPEVPLKEIKLAKKRRDMYLKGKKRS